MSIKLFFFLNLLYFLLSSFAWPSAFIPNSVIVFGGIFIYLLFFYDKKVTISLSQTNILIISAFLIYLCYNIFLGAYLITFSYLPAVLLCFIDADIKNRLLNYITKWYAIIITSSIIVFGITSFIEISPIGIIQNYFYQPFLNYVLYVKPTDIFNQVRFNGIFYEPGHCALVGSFLLMANRFNLKKNLLLIPIFISVMLTLSLAGYVLIAVGLTLLYFNKIKIVLYSVIFTIISFFFVTSIWNEGDNPVNNLIVARLEYSEEGGIKGNNRAYMATDYVLNEAIEHNKVWTGIGLDKFNQLFNHTIAGSGYKIFILQYGIIGLLLVNFLFFCFTFTSLRRNRKFAFLFFIFIELAFLQRCYSFWFSWQLPYICSLVTIYNTKIYGNEKQKIRLSDYRS